MPAPFEVGFITQAFRDIADQDYIAARTLYRAGLDLQFLWASSQAMEKYLKGILLYNALDTRDLGHKLVASYKRVLTISDIPFNFPPDTGAFLEYLELYGPDRYLQHPYFTHGEELLQLDRIVWHVRRFCQYLRGELRKPSGERVRLLEAHIRSLSRPALFENPTRFRILGGYLERVPDSNRTALRANLVWKNTYFGDHRRRRHVRSFPARSVSVNPVHFLEPDVFWHMRKRVKFPRPVVAYFEALRAEKRRQ
jgi:HEPN domain-containing protein